MNHIEQAICSVCLRAIKHHPCPWNQSFEAHWIFSSFADRWWWRLSISERSADSADGLCTGFGTFRTTALCLPLLVACTPTILGPLRVSMTNSWLSEPAGFGLEREYHRRWFLWEWKKGMQAGMHAAITPSDCSRMTTTVMGTSTSAELLVHPPLLN